MGDLSPNHLKFARNTLRDTFPKWKIQDADGTKFSKVAFLIKIMNALITIFVLMIIL